MIRIQSLVMILSGLIFVFSVALTAMFGTHAIQTIEPLMKVAAGDSLSREHVIVMRACLYTICKDWLANRIIRFDPHNLEALGTIAIGFAKRGLWHEAEPKFDQYFAEGGNAPEVQKWYQKLQSHQARVESE